MTTWRISEDASELALPARGPERAVDLGLRHHKVERAVERLRLRPGPQHPARAIEFPLVELHVLVPQRGRLHPSLPRLMRLILLDTVDVHNIGLGEHRIKTNLAGRP